jgi:hypothetical protein
MPDDPLIIENAVRPAPKKRPSWQTMLEIAARIGQPADPMDASASIFADDAPPIAPRAESIFAEDAAPIAPRPVTAAPAPRLSASRPAAKRPAWVEMKEAAERLGGRVTSTTGGTHNVGSKHYGGEAIDVGMASDDKMDALNGNV